MTISNPTKAAKISKLVLSVATAARNHTMAMGALPGELSVVLVESKNTVSHRPVGRPRGAPCEADLPPGHAATRRPFQGRSKQILDPGRVQPIFSFTKLLYINIS